MITERKCRTLLDVALRHAAGRVDGIEVTIFFSNISTSRFANNGMTQNQSPSRTEISVRVLKDGRQARLASEGITAAAVRKLTDDAILACALLAPDKEMLPLPADAALLPAVLRANRFDHKTASFSAADRARQVKAIVDVARAKSLTAAGVFETGSFVQAIGNNQGLFRFHRQTSAECSITMKAIDESTLNESTGWSKAHSTRVGDIDATALAERAALKAIASANPQDVEPGNYTVILEPAAVLDLVSFLLEDFTGTSHVDKLSCFLGKVGQKALGDNITIVDDAGHALQAGAPFDGEGLPRSRVTLVENGVIKNLLAGRSSAAKLGCAPTGHGLSEPSPEGEAAANIVIEGGKATLDEMIKSTRHGILLTRVWYVRQVDPTSKLVTGMTRDGTFLVQDGAIKCGIKNLRFNQSLIEMLNNVAALGPSLATAGEEGQPAVVPAMLVNNFHFASGTRF